MTQRNLDELSKDECLKLLRQQHVGRLVYQDAAGPTAEPVNYAMAADDIVIRVEGGAKLAAMKQPSIAFEVDRIEDHAHLGWSVIVRGAGREIPLEEVAHVLHMIDGDPPRPWAAGVHNRWLQLRADTMTGRRFGAVAAAPPM